MKKIGFSVNTDEKKVEMKTLIPAIEEEPVLSVVNVRFQSGKEYPYLNTKFNLKVGDFVYVDGKLYGQLGKVTSVTTKFKVSLKYYKEVISKLDTNFHGKFKKFNSFMISKNCTLDFAQMDEWFIAPEILEEGEEPEEFILGEGYECSISKFFECKGIDLADVDEAIDILSEGCVKAVSIIDGCGHAILKNHKVRRVDFMIEDGMIKNIYCDCISPDFCKHAIAVCLLIKDLVEKEIIKEDENFTAIDADYFNLFMSEIEI